MKKIFLSLFLCFALTQLLADSLDIKIGQMIMAGMKGHSVNQQSGILQDVKKGIVGGILLFERNLNPASAKKSLQNLTTNLQNAATIPLIISIDQEGGQVNRLKTKYGFPVMPSAKSVGDKNNDDYTTEIAQRMALSLISCGINLNYAPVLDLHDVRCPVLGKRSRCFSANPEIVAHVAGLYIETHRNQGVRTVVKHFPGHGSSRTDSHLGLTDVSKYWTKKELRPYEMLIQEGVVDMVMTAHVVNRQLDQSGLPATLSKTILQDVLRKQLGFQGVIVSDDMQMHAISSNYGFEESIKMAILAGVDILMFSNNISQSNNYSPGKIHSTIRQMVKQGLISEKRIDESYRRIMAFKQKLTGSR
jgi:beta-N-acetylhexosaminidase